MQVSLIRESFALTGNYTYRFFNALWRVSLFLEECGYQCELVDE
jgi:hypothetical protein